MVSVAQPLTWRTRPGADSLFQAKFYTLTVYFTISASPCYYDPLTMQPLTCKRGGPVRAAGPTADAC